MGRKPGKRLSPSPPARAIAQPNSQPPASTQPQPAPPTSGQSGLTDELNLFQEFLKFKKLQEQASSTTSDFAKPKPPGPESTTARSPASDQAGPKPAANPSPELPRPYASVLAASLPSSNSRSPATPSLMEIDTINPQAGPSFAAPAFDTGSSSSLESFRSRSLNRGNQSRSRSSSWKQVTGRNARIKRKSDDRQSSYQTGKRAYGRLQSYLINRPPPPHPTDAMLALLTPGKYIRVDNIFYFRAGEGEDDFVVLENGKHHSDIKDPNALLHQYGLVYPRTEQSNPAEVMKPRRNMPESVLKNAKLFLPPVDFVNREHKKEGTKCHCSPHTCEHHQVGMLEMVCLKKDFVRKPDNLIAIPAPDKDDDYSKLKPNSGRIYCYSSNSKKAVLQLPTPFWISWRWEPRKYLPAQALDGPGPAQDLFYTLHDSAVLRDTMEPYLTEPQDWTRSSHPLICEPRDSEELAIWSRNQYSVETLFRTLPPRHPLRGNQLPVYAAIEADFSMPAIVNDKDLGSLERYLSERLYPFYSQGFGQIMCAVCLFLVEEGSFRPALYSRKSYLLHFRKEHLTSVPVLGLGFSTNLGLRIYQALTVYHYCLAHVTATSQDNTDRAPLCSVSESFQLMRRSELREMLMNRGQGDLISRYSRRPLVFGWREQPADNSAEDDSLESRITDLQQRMQSLPDGAGSLSTSFGTEHRVEFRDKDSEDEADPFGV